MAERFRKITDHGVMPTPSGAGALLLHQEEGSDCLLLLGVFRPADKANLVAIATFEMCMQSTFGYPNDEAYGCDPRGESGDTGYGFFEVIDSTWPGRLIEYNQHAFPKGAPPHYATMRHFFVGCHDASGEFLADGMKLELTTGTFHEAADEAMNRLIGPSR